MLPSGAGATSCGPDPDGTAYSCMLVVGSPDGTETVGADWGATGVALDAAGRVGCNGPWHPIATMTSQTITSKAGFAFLILAFAPIVMILAFTFSSSLSEFNMRILLCQCPIRACSLRIDASELARYNILASV